MILKTLSILNFKNIEQTSLTFSAKLNCLVGANGVGKTNLLDAIYYLSFCRSAFSNTNMHVLRHDQTDMMIQGLYAAPDGEEYNIFCGIKGARRKTLKKNGKEYNKVSEHIGMIPLVLVSPSDSELILGTGEPRRKFIDTAISQYSPQYLQHLIKYNQALQQRNSLLKSETQPDDALIDAYDQMLHLSGQAIYEKRKEFIEKFTPIFNKVYSQLGNTDERVTLNYQSHLHDKPLLELLQANHQKDYIVGHTLVGIHRDDLDMRLSDYPIRYEGSQGQTKTYLTALRLAQYLYLKEVSANRVPILLLDDIFDKLDSERVARIIRIVSSPEFGQIFVTSTSRETLHQVIQQSTHDYRFFTVNNGNYEES